jgi:hypothetical protein
MCIVDNSAGVVLYFKYLNIQANEVWEVKIQTFGRICTLDLFHVRPETKIENQNVCF